MNNLVGFVIGVFILLGLIVMCHLSWIYGYNAGKSEGVESYRNICEPYKNTELYKEMKCDK